ncbi:MAG: oxidase [Sulfolobaceae archaeon]
MKNEDLEFIWLAIVLVLLIVLVILTAGPIFNDVGGVPTSVTQIPNNVPVINVKLIANQYYFKVYETGLIESKVIKDNISLPYYNNIIIAKIGSWLNITMISNDVTHNLYVPIFNTKVINVQILPQIKQYASMPVPSIPGFYTFLGGEYSGPWYAYEVGGILVLPQDGQYYSLNELSKYIQTTQAAHNGQLNGDPYNPPIFVYNTTSPIIYLKGNEYGIFNNSIPGPTIVVNKNSDVRLKIFIPRPNNDHNYLYNYTNGEPNPITLRLGVYAVWWNGTITEVKEFSVNYDSEMEISFKAIAPAYIYGMIEPVYYVYNVANMSNLFNGIQKGYIMGLWGIILVTGD